MQNSWPWQVEAISCVIILCKCLDRSCNSLSVDYNEIFVLLETDIVRSWSTGSCEIDFRSHFVISLPSEWVNLTAVTAHATWAVTLVCVLLYKLFWNSFEDDFLLSSLKWSFMHWETTSPKDTTGISQFSYMSNLFLLVY